MESLNKLKEMFYCEIDKIVDQGELTAGSLESASKLLDAIKDIGEISMHEEDEGYAQRGYGGHIMYYPNDMYYDGGNMGGNSYRSGRMRMPHNGGGNSYRGGRYSYDDGKDQMLEQLYQMMDQAGTEKERQAIQKCIRQMEQG